MARSPERGDSVDKGLALVEYAQYGIAAIAAGVGGLALKASQPELAIASGAYAAWNVAQGGLLRVARNRRTKGRYTLAA